MKFPLLAPLGVGGKMRLSCSLAEMSPYISHVLEQDFQKWHRVSHSRLPFLVGGNFFFKKRKQKNRPALLSTAVLRFHSVVFGSTVFALVWTSHLAGLTVFKTQTGTVVNI